MAKGKRTKRPDPLSVQVRARVRRGAAVTAQRLREATERWARTGETGDADIQITAVNWRNPARPAGSDFTAGEQGTGDGWKTSEAPGESVEGARETLRLASGLRGGAVRFAAVGQGGGSRTPKKAAARLRRRKNSKPTRRLPRAKNRRVAGRVDKARPNKARLARGSAASRKLAARRTGRAASDSRKRSATRNAKPHARARHSKKRSRK